MSTGKRLRRATLVTVIVTLLLGLTWPAAGPSIVGAVSDRETLLAWPAAGRSIVGAVSDREILNERQTNFTVTQVSPPNAAHDVVPNTVVSASFSLPVDFSTVSTRTFTVRGQQTGDYSGTYATVTGALLFDAARDFRPGEEMLVHLSDGLQALDGTPLTPYAWSFRAAVLAGTGIYADSDQSLGNSNSRGVALGDLDGDGDLDAFVGNEGQANEVWFNDGVGVFANSGQELGSSSSYDIALGDVDNDGDLDAVAANNGPNKVWLNDGTGTFIDSGQSLGSVSSRGVALGDLDGDGDLDAFVANGWPAYGNQPNQVYFNDGSGSFSDSGQALGDRRSIAVALGDLDSDGDLDALVGNWGAWGSRVWLNDGTGTFSGGYGLGMSKCMAVALGDLEADGDLDAFVANSEYQPNQVWLNDGTGYFVDSGQQLGSASSQAVGLGDLDGDADLDAFVANFSYEPNRVWFNDGTGVFTESGQYLGNASSTGVGAGDLDGDDDPDAFVTNASVEANKVWLNLNSLTLFPLTPRGYANVGASVLYELTLINGTGQTDNFLLALSGNTWSTTLSLTETGSLDPGDGLTFTVQVSVPLATSPGHSDVVVLTATSASSPTIVSHPARITTMAQDCHARINDEPTAYTNVQSAVDAAAPGDVVKVAGYCAAINSYSANSQIVYINKTVTLRGGYTTTNGFANPPDPIANPTTLDAHGRGRVLFITGPGSPTVEGLRITGGDAAGLEGCAGNSGGGICASGVFATISDNRIFGNIAERGGGLCLIDVYGIGGATLVANWIFSNTASVGGGLAAREVLITLTNNMITDNYGDVSSGVDIKYGNAVFQHNTIARNDGGSGVRVHGSWCEWWCCFGSAVLTNTVVASHTIGVDAGYCGWVTMEGTLWGSGAWGNEQDWSVHPYTAILVTGTVNLWAHPAFVDPDAGDYHIGPGSGAINAGVTTTVAFDIDGEPRPYGPGFDIGADELLPSLRVTKQASPDPVPAGAPLTYTLRVTNTGLVTLTATITDVLPAQVIPTGVLTWTAQITPSGLWVESFTVTVDSSYVGPLTNVVQVNTEEGAASAYTHTAMVVDEPIAGLSALNDSPTALGNPTMLSATITAGSNVTYAWELGYGALGIGPLLTHTYPATGTYTALVTASNSVSLLTSTTTVLVEEAIAGLTAFNDSPTVLGDPTTLSATITAGSNVSFTWDLGDSTFASGAVPTHTYPAAGTYVALVTTSNSVSLLTATTTVIVEEAIAGLTAFNDSPTVLGAPTTLSATITAGSNVSYSWDLGDGASGIGPLLTHTYPTAGTYTALVTASNSVNTLTATTTVIVDEPIAGLSALNDGPTALGDPTTLSATVTAGSNVSYTWKLEHGSWRYGAVVSYTYPAVGSYTAVVTASNSVSTLTATTDVTILSPCTPVTGTHFSWVPLTPTIGQAVTFSATVAGGDPPITYTWDFGDGSGGSGTVVTHSYGMAGDYSVTLTATNCVMATQTVVATITVAPVVPPPEYRIYLPLILQGWP